MYNPNLWMQKTIDMIWHVFLTIWNTQNGELYGKNYEEQCKIAIEKTCDEVSRIYNDNFRMNTSYGRYGAAYNMVGFSWFNEELSLLPKNPTEAMLQATSTRGESTEPTKGVMKHTYKAVLYNYCLMQYCCILFYQLVSREGCNPNQWEKVSKSMDSSSIGNR
jgi:hypothetical protein